MAFKHEKCVKVRFISIIKTCICISMLFERIQKGGGESHIVLALFDFWEGMYTSKDFNHLDFSKVSKFWLSFRMHNSTIFFSMLEQIFVTRHSGLFWLFSTIYAPKFALKISLCVLAVVHHRGIIELKDRVRPQSHYIVSFFMQRKKTK